MTCIAGYAQGGEVWIGGDSGSTNGDDYRLIKHPKVFKLKRLKSEMLIGFAGCFRRGQIIQYALDIPKHPQGISNMKYMSTIFADTVFELYESNAQIETLDEDNNDAAATDLLIGYRKELFILADDYSVFQHDTPYEVIGQGSDYALGSFFALLEEAADYKGPEYMIRCALDTAAQFSDMVRPPFKILKL